jgi:hypothetical protein
MLPTGFPLTLFILHFCLEMLTPTAVNEQAGFLRSKQRQKNLQHLLQGHQMPNASDTRNSLEAKNSQFFL